MRAPVLTLCCCQFLDEMKCRNLTVILQIAMWFLAIGAVLLIIRLQDLGDQYGVVDYFTFTVSPLKSRPPLRQDAPGSFVGDKVIVMAKMEHEDTSWVAEELPGYSVLKGIRFAAVQLTFNSWQRAIYTVNPSARSSDILTTKINKGHESMAYLTYIIDNYDSSLPSTMAFLHSHRRGFLKAWHTDSPMHDNVNAMRSLQLPYVARNGYVNLRCNWNPGCGRHESSTHVSTEIWDEVFNRTSTSWGDNAGNWEDSIPDEESPSHALKNSAVYLRGHTAAACCAQFAVSRFQVHQRPREDYIKFRDWLYHTEKNDAESGRVMEYLWHVIFGKDSV